jgi:TolB-like protein/tetratricopeptide (TPR) repeat protein
LLPLPDKPSLIVLPLKNMSGDPEQEYFSDGLTEDITADLSKLSGFFVIARNSAFTYKGKAMKVQDISQEMGVRYILEGSVRKVGEQVRVTVQLIDGTTGGHVWAGRYDRPLKDVFTVQDEIVQELVTTLRVEVHEAEQQRVRRLPTTNLSAYDSLLRAAEYFHRVTPEGVAQARPLYEQAVALDPQYGEAYAWLGWTYWEESHWNPDPQKLEQAMALAQQAIALNDSLAVAHSLASLISARRHQSEQAIAEGERAVALDPNSATSAVWLGEVLIYEGRPAEAIGWAEKAMRLDPHYPYWFAVVLSNSYALTGRYAEAIAASKQGLLRSPHGFLYQQLTGAYLAQWGAQLSQDLQTVEQALAAAQQAVALLDSFWGVHGALGYAYLCQQHYERAVAEMERAVALYPTGAENYASLAEVLSRAGRVDEALRAAEQARGQKSQLADFPLFSIGIAYALAGRYEDALAPLKQFLTRYPELLRAHLTLAAVCSELGREAEARAEAAEVLRLNPRFSLEVHKQRVPIKDPAVLERHLAALRKAGLK